jgi:heme/copper-type cytochrome/quinol oxidase subunit 4
MKIIVERNTIILLILISLTLLTSFFIHSKYSVIAILFFAFIKINLVAFHFMELKYPHRIWKVAFLLFASFLLTILGIFLLY